MVNNERKLDPTAFLAELQKRLASSNGDRKARRELSYLKAYSHIVNHFKAQAKFDEASITTAALLVYGWMPTIPVLNFSAVEKAWMALNRAKETEAERLQNEEIEAVMAFVNQSLVGTSKLLHFVNPEMYAIYDSRVVASAKAMHPLQKGASKVDHYVNYLNQLEAKKSELTAELVAQVKEKLQYEVSPLRILEMFYFFGSD